VMGGDESRLGYYCVVWTHADHDQSPTWAGLRYIN
jgi:hypothetical protein